LPARRSLSFDGLRRSVLCGTFRPVTGPGRYPAHCPAEFGLSSTERGAPTLPRKRSPRKPFEESPNSTGQGAGSHPGGASPRNVQQRADRQRTRGCPKGRCALRARVKRCGKSAPAVPVTGPAWQTPPGARPHRGGGVCPAPLRPRGRSHRGAR
jgi:hypothetical protein